MKSFYKLSVFVVTFGMIFSCVTTHKTVITFKNGSKKTGEGSLSGNSIYFKEAGEEKSQTYSFDDVSSVNYYEDGNINKYVKVKVKGQSYPLILIEVIEGKVSLYKYIQRSTNIPGQPSSMMGSDKIEVYYLKRNNENEATHLGSSNMVLKNFIKATSEYFKDCPDLVDKIHEESYNKNDIEKIVWYYISHCN
jgi:hypothetical protein